MKSYLGGAERLERRSLAPDVTSGDFVSDQFPFSVENNHLRMLGRKALSTVPVPGTYISLSLSLLF